MSHKKVLRARFLILTGAGAPCRARTGIRRRNGARLQAYEQGRVLEQELVTF